MKRIVYLIVVSLLMGCSGGGGDSGGENSGSNSTPIVTTITATSITPTSAILNGTSIPNGLTTQSWFEYGTDSALSTYTTSVKQDAGDGLTSQAANMTWNGLSAGTTYYFRFCAENSKGYSKGVIVSFTTSSPNDPPTVTTLSATSVGATTATLNGNVTPNGLATITWFEWGIDPSLTIYSNTMTQSVGSGTTSQLVNFPLSGLTAGTTYYYRLVASNSPGTRKGSILSFVPGAAPTVTTITATSVGITTATLNGSITTYGLATNAWFEYGTDPFLASFTSTSSQSVGPGTTSQSVNVDLNGLFPVTTYYYRVAASNSSGTSRGSITNFLTGIPNVTTLAATWVGATGATLNGNVEPNGLTNTAWFVWGTDPSMTIYSETTKQLVGSGTTSQLVSFPLNGLATGTTYYYYLVASASISVDPNIPPMFIVSGSTASFTTTAPNNPPTVMTLAATSVGATGATLNGNVTPNGLATTTWFEWGTAASLATYSTTPTQSVGSGTMSIPVNTALSGLSKWTTYYCRVAAYNTLGMSRGPIVSFTVIPPQPDPGVADIRDEFLTIVNQARSVNQICGNTSYGPAPPVAWSANLAMAAYLHSIDMATNNNFSHTGSDGSSAGTRITREGYNWATYGENIAVGYPTVSAVMQGWLGSEGHCRNIMNPAFEEIGAGYAEGPFGGSQSARYWTFDLASPR